MKVHKIYKVPSECKAVFTKCGLTLEDCDVLAVTLNNEKITCQKCKQHERIHKTILAI